MNQGFARTERSNVTAISQPAFVVQQPLLPFDTRPHIRVCHVRRRPARRSASQPCTIQSRSSCLSSQRDEEMRTRLNGRNIVIAGGTGLIGSALVQALRDANTNISLLSRNPSRTRSRFLTTPGPPPSVLLYDAATSDPLSEAALAAVTNADVVVNLAGEPVEEARWTPERKDLLFKSRVTGTRKIVHALRSQRSNAVLINASAVGYYGTSEDKAFTEDDGPGTDYLAKLASAWETAALSNKKNSRTVVFRIGVVLARKGGALEKMSAAFKAFLGGPPGGGTQWFSWVHIDDVVRLIVHASVDEKWDGIYNANAPQPVRLAKFCHELGQALGRPSWLPVPRQAVQMLLGNEAAELILAGQCVLPKRARQNGFVYKYKDVVSALHNLIKADATLTNVK